MPEPPTSASSHRAPERPWGLIWSVALVAFFGIVIAAEVWFRSLGLVPMIQDDSRLWAMWRSRLEEPSQKTRVVLLGTSRMQLGVDPQIVGEVLGDEFDVINLSSNGFSPVPVLHHLAEDARFGGVVIAEYHPRAVYGEKKSWEAKASKWVQFYNQKAWTDDLETALRVFFEERLTIILPEVEPLTLASLLLKHRKLPEPSYISPRHDRFIAADYTKVDEELFGGDDDAEDDPGQQNLRPEPEMTERLVQIRDDVGAIEARGGQVFFVRMVVSGDTREFEELACPRDVYYRRFTESVPEATHLHYVDDPVLSSFECADGAHLDYRDAGPYTRRLAELVAAQID